MTNTLLSGIDGLLVTNATNIRYLTGFAGAAPEEREAYVLLTKKQLYLFTSALYLEQARQLSDDRIQIIEVSRENPISKELATISKKLGAVGLGFEETNLTVLELTKLKHTLRGLSLIPTQDRIEVLRMIKRPDEIANIRLAANLTDQCFKFITHRIRPGVTESRLALEIEGFLRYRGAENAFSPIVAFNEHSSQPHYHTRSFDPLRRGSLILLDFGAKINGYCADMTRVVFVGSPKEQWRKAYLTVLAAQQTALNTLKKGERSGKKLDTAAQNVIRKAKLPVYPHSLGHAVGLDIHESPRLSVKKDELLREDMVVTIEPGVYVEGQYGIRIEDLIRLTRTGIDVLTTSPKELIIV